MNTAAPDNPSQRYATLLTRLLGGGDWPRALETARGWLAEDPESMAAHLGAAQALINLERYAQARPHLTRVLASNPRHGFALRLASIASFHAKDFAGADKYIQEALASQPENFHHWYHLAWMRYQHGALDLAAKYARRSLELQPNNANIVNLLALCEHRDDKARLAQYRRALELDPENSLVHNNLGGYYLDVEKDYAAAGECFRRALRLNPSDKNAQRNLFTVLRHRDKFYRLLTLPRTLVTKLSWRRSRAGVLTKVLLVALWLSVGRYLLVLLIVWFALVYPLLKAYEYLTLADLRAEVGVPGARRGGFLGHRRWPFAARFGLFAVLTVLFWGGLVLLYWREAYSPEVLAGVLAAGIFIYLGYFLFQQGRRFRRGYLVARGEKKLDLRLYPRRPGGFTGSPSNSLYTPRRRP